MADADIERRLIEIDTVVERCACDKTGKKKAVIRGYAALYNSDSVDLGGFTERILPGAFDGVMKRGTDVVALYNHDPAFLLGRESSGTLRLSVDDRGLRYEIDAPDSRADVVEAIERGDVRGSSFAFRVKPAQENWSRTSDGRQLREIREVDGLFDVGPVMKPAYGATESFVSRRALEMAQGEEMPPDEDVEEGEVSENNYELYEAIERIAEENGQWSQAEAHYIQESPFAEKGIKCGNCVFWEMGKCEVVEGQIAEEGVCKLWIIPEQKLTQDEAVGRSEGVDLKPTAGMASAANRGLRLHEEGKSGDGLKPETVARANKLANREEMNRDWVVEMNAWFKRHAVDKKAGWDDPGSESPGFVAFLLWGGTAGAEFSARKVAELERAGESRRDVAEVAKAAAKALEAAARVAKR